MVSRFNFLVLIVGIDAVKRFTRASEIRRVREISSEELKSTWRCTLN